MSNVNKENIKDVQMSNQSGQIKKKEIENDSEGLSKKTLKDGFVKSSSIQNSYQYCWNVLTLDAKKSVIPDNCLKKLKGNGKHIEQFVKLKRL